MGSIPILSKFYERNHRKGLEIFGLSVDQPRDRDQVIKTAKESRYPMAMLNEAKTNGFGSVRSLPITYVVDREGKIRAVFRPGESDLTEKALLDAVGPGF